MKTLFIKLTLLAFISIFILSHAALSAEATDEKSDANVLVRIGDDVITKAELETALNKVPQNRREKYRERILAQLIEVKVFSKEAEKAALDKDPQVEKDLERATNEILAQYFVKKYIDKEAELPEEEIKKYYDEHKDQFVVPEGVLIQLIVVNKMEEAEAILKELKDGASFEELAKKKSIDLSREKGGHLDWLYKGRMEPELEKAAFNMEKGLLSDIIQTKKGYQIIKVLDKSDKRQISFEDAKANMRNEFFWRKKRELIDKYYKEAKVNREPAEKDVLFKIGDDTFKEEILADILNKFSGKEREKLKKRWVDYLLETKVFSKEARKVSLEKDPEVAHELKRKTDEILANTFRKRFIEDKFQVSDKEIADFYQSHLEDFRIPTKVRVKTIVVKTKEEAENIMKELKDGAAFDNLAKEKSIHPSASKGGGLGWFGKGGKDPELEKAVFSLEKEQISEILKTEEGYQIIKVVDKRGGEVEPLDKVNETIKKMLKAKHFEKEKTQYYEKANVKVLGENIK